MVEVLMGYIYEEDLKNIIFKASKFFNRVFKDEWLDDELVKRMILDVDKSEVLGNRVIKSPVLGLISPRELSGGVKSLILMYKRDEIIDATNCGDNCAKWILEIGDKKDIKIYLGYQMKFWDDNKNQYDKFRLKIKYYFTNEEWFVDNILDYVDITTDISYKDDIRMGLT